MGSDLQTYNFNQNSNWFWWPLFPLYPYGTRNTIFKELVSEKVWCFEQLQGLYYVAVPIRMTVVKVPKGLMLFNPLPPTKALIDSLKVLQQKHGPICTIVLPTASGLEHKIPMPAMARAFPKATLWLCPGQWSFPLALPLTWLGFPPNRTRTLFADGLPHQDSCRWISLGPIDIGLGRFQEISCYHKESQSLLVTDALIGIESEPPEIFDLDPTPLLFHAREKGDEPLKDSFSLRKKGWKRLVLFASYLKPDQLKIPSIKTIIKNCFKPGLRNWKSHFGIYPFEWEKNWELSTEEIIGVKSPLLQVAPVIERLVFPRAKSEFLRWLDEIKAIKGMKRIIPAHYSAPINFNDSDCKALRNKINFSEWAPSEKSWSFLGKLDQILLNKNIVPKNPLKAFRD
ncbi:MULTISPECIES: DUF4336 domain-containing protein [Prochlorococcus]|uniref:DUF4336 domain-containing protein n=1 Tax=Prochlorococcus marinus (strain SARG / CCMP1375 / SS120) TaxID=167539 RepID=Q7VBN5_PROMA|nr:MULTISPECIES: DUF4336 domain-containing protein [Prochlorococcus]AAQ00102.1 Uncharacterized protein Pro_1057 [Prochlorococcus marinus subsp. marinus str. CCMP1375]KGG13898.1 hypothetical protein EV04_0383 [Prochlorococcus marinus str. LG]KGG19031.1 hypothetical protein EV08_1518 [Prochlorococcus marinus str. SS2]KGG23429.1 hypothetical protein EV09_1053 [Prochlorococcus marinus str. SS35]KGG32335.1 hypothetical protein EV10_1450 [Prochlorococcus marinus str. SS51]